MMRRLCGSMILVLALVACDRKEQSKPSTTTTGQTVTAEVNVPDAGESAAKQVIEPSDPTYEDAPGVVRRDGKNRWVIVPDDGSKPVCAPAELPADVTEVGAKVRFTLYAEDDESAGCRPVEMFVSIRRVG